MVAIYHCWSDQVWVVVLINCGSNCSRCERQKSKMWSETNFQSNCWSWALVKILLPVQSYVCVSKATVTQSVMLFISGSTHKVWSPPQSAEEMVEGELIYPPLPVEGKEEAGEEVEFLDTTVTVSHLPSVQFPQPATRSKGTRLVDRWKNLLHHGFFRQNFPPRFEAAFYSLGSFAAEKPLPVIIACSLFTALGCAGLPFIRFLLISFFSLWVWIEWLTFPGQRTMRSSCGFPKRATSASTTPGCGQTFLQSYDRYSSNNTNQTNQNQPEGQIG